MNTFSYKIFRELIRLLRKTLAMGPDRKTAGITSVQSISDEEFFNFFNVDEISLQFLEDGGCNHGRFLVQHYEKKFNNAPLQPPSVITDLRVNISELSSEALSRLADSILNLDISPEWDKPALTSEGTIDWDYNPTSSPEWLWRLHRHQWWPVLGIAYNRLGDERYAAAFVEQMLDWVSKHPLPESKNENSPCWRLMEAGMRLRVSWIPCFALFSDAETFTEDAKIVMLRSIYDHANFLYTFHTKLNHLVRESNGLLCASIYFSEFKDASDWQRTALKRLEDELQKQINRDGSHIEMSIGYQWVVLDEYEKSFELLEIGRLALPNTDLGDYLEKMYTILAKVIRPDGSFPEINDGFLRWSYRRFLNAGKLFGRSDFDFIGSSGATGSPPGFTSSSIVGNGLHTMRSSWSTDARYLLFDSGPYGGNHGHEDKLSIEVFAYGQPFIVDSGSYTYEVDDPYRNYFVGSQSHNTILVDGKSQVRRWFKDTYKAKLDDGPFAKWITQNAFDYASACYEDGYGNFQMSRPEVAEIISDVRHRRSILFVKPDYWVVVDELEASDHHDYTLLFHAHPDITAEMTNDKTTLLRSGNQTPNLLIVPAAASEVQARIAIGEQNPIQGWYSLNHQRKTESSVVIYEKKHKKAGVFATLLYPFNREKTTSLPEFSPVEVEGETGRCFTVKTADGIDYLLISDNSGTKSFGGFQSEGQITIIRMSEMEEDVNRIDYNE